MRKNETEILAKAIASANLQYGSYPENELSSFLSMKGDLYDGKLMIIGRAVNGWRTTWEPNSQPLGAEIALSEETLKDVTRPNSCPMLWVTDKWNGTTSSSDKYKTRSSAYWRVTKEIVQQLDIADIKLESWPSHLVWSNLWKLSHSENGNPSEALQNIQFESCVELLLAELSIYKPQKVLMLTGLNWAKPFLEKIGIQWEKPLNSRYVEAIAEFSGSSIVIAQHPQCKKEGPFIGEVISNFNNNIGLLEK